MLSVRERLSSDEGRAGLLDQGAKPIQIEVAGEDRVLPIPRILDLDPARRMYVDPAPRVRGERRSALLGERPKEELHRTERVVGRTDVGMPQDPRDDLVQGLEVPRSGIGFVTDQLSGQLFLGHRARPQGDHVEGHLGRRQLVDIESSRGQIPLPFLQVGERYRADCLDLMGLVNRLVRGRHGSVS